MKFNMIKKCKEHEFLGYQDNSLGFNIKIGRLEIEIMEPKKGKIVNKCTKCDKIKKL